MTAGYFINAVCTPLNEDETLHRDGLAAHLADQWDHGIDGLLIAGGMGMTPMLREDTYRELVEQGVALAKGKCEVIVGAADTSFARAKQRIEFINQFDVDGVVVLTAYYVNFSQAMLVDFYHGLADVCRAPLYAYDLPRLTGQDIDMDTYVQLARHPNIKGAKLSGRFTFARQVIDELGSEFRVVLAEPEITDVLLRTGFDQLLDGIYSLAPHWTAELRRAAAAGDWDQAAVYTRKIQDLRILFPRWHTPTGVMTALLNTRGIEGKANPAPFPKLNAEQMAQFMQTPIIQEYAQSKLSKVGG